MSRQFILVSSLLVLSSCGVAPQEFHRLERQVTTMQRDQAERATQVAELEGSVRQLSGRLEEIQYLVERRFGSTIESLRGDVSTLQRRVPPPSIVPADALEDDEAFASKLSGSAGQALGEALGQIRQGNFRNAEPLPRSAVDELGIGGEAAYPLFWLGVVGDGLGDSRSALAAYNQLSTQFPRSPRTPLGLLRLSSVFTRLGDPTAAKLTLQKLIAEYPKSPEAARAKERLSDFPKAAPKKR